MLMLQHLMLTMTHFSVLVYRSSAYIAEFQSIRALFIVIVPVYLHQL